MATAPKAAPIGYDDPEAGRQVFDPSRSRASSSGTASDEPPPTTVGPTGLFGPGGIYSGLTRSRNDPKKKAGRHLTKKHRKTKKKMKKAGRRKSRR